jgi:hypothetical protein
MKLVTSRCAPTRNAGDLPAGSAESHAQRRPNTPRANEADARLAVVSVLVVMRVVGRVIVGHVNLIVGCLA